MKRLLKSDLNKEEAKQVGTLYHYTSINHLLNILETNTLKVSEDWENISFTRNQDFEKSNRIITSIECRLDLDGDKLSENYKIEPFNYYKKSKEPKRLEQEEIVKREINPVIPYIKSITMITYDVEEYKDEIEKIKSFGIEVNVKKSGTAKIFNEDKSPNVEYIRTNKDKLINDDWYYISKYQYLTDDFIREFKNYIIWGTISQFQKLSESMIKEFNYMVSWYHISKYQELSYNFIMENKDYLIDFSALLENKNISQETLDKLKEEKIVAKLKRLIKKSNNTFRKILADWQPVDVGNPNLVQLITDIMAAGAQMQINYQNSGWRLIQPINFKTTKDGNVLIMCYKVDTGEVRSYRLDRVSEVLMDDNMVPEVMEQPGEIYEVNDYQANPEDYTAPALPEQEELLQISEEEEGLEEPYDEALETLRS